jgi:hypothetical protein
MTEHGIDGRKLLMLTHHDLEKIGIDKLTVSFKTVF